MKIVLLFIFVFSFVYGDFTKSGDVVINNYSNLEWQDDDTSGATMTWTQAIDYCENLSLDSHDDWRLPNINELKSVIDKSRYNPAVVSAFTNMTSDQYWSSSTYEPLKSLAWIVIFLDGKESGGRKTYSKHVRCVRGGQL